MKTIGRPILLMSHGGRLSLTTRYIRVLATKIFGNISVGSTRTLSRGEETLLSSGWTLIGSELFSPNFNSSLELNDRSRFFISTE